MTPSMSAPAVVLNATDIGRCGENLTAYHLEMMGVACSLVDRRGSDIWCRTPAGVLFSLEVKTASSPTTRGVKDSRSTYAYQVRSRNSDWYAFVALDRELIIFKPKSGLLTYESHRFDPNYFKPAVMQSSLQQMIRVTDLPITKEKAA